MHPSPGWGGRAGGPGRGPERRRPGRADGLSEAPTPEVVAAHRDQLRAILWQTGEARSLQQKGHSFEQIARSASPRVIATPVIVAFCVGTFAIMAARGVSPVEPTAQELYPWGANFGPGVIVDGEVWRLLSCMFLHFGFMHLAFNMWCLVKAGPLAERLFGHLGFAVLYLLSGLGGSLASLWYHPMIVSAGASGAIFGVFGALLGCSVARSHALSASALKPLRSSVLTFIAYNIAFGLMNTGIDNAAHLGGLLTGPACGLVLSRPAGRVERGLGPGPAPGRGHRDRGRTGPDLPVDPGADPRPDRGRPRDRRSPGRPATGGGRLQRLHGRRQTPHDRVRSPRFGERRRRPEDGAGREAGWVHHARPGSADQEVRRERRIPPAPWRSRTPPCVRPATTWPRPRATWATTCD